MTPHLCCEMCSAPLHVVRALQTESRWYLDVMCACDLELGAVRLVIEKETCD